MMRKILSKRLMALPLPLLAMALPGLAHAAGFYLQEQSVKGSGRAYSGEVADTGAESLWWNPAAIGGLEGGDASIGVSAILPTGDVTNIGTQIVYPSLTPTPQPIGGAQSVHNPLQNGYLPSGSIAYGLNKQLAVGLTITSPYSFTTKYPDGTWASYTAGETKLRTYDIQPSVAVVPVPGLSLGAAINVERTTATLTNFLPNFAPGAPDGSQTLTGSGWDVGFTVGAQWHSGPLSLGASYKSAIRHHLDGTVVIAGLVTPLAGYDGTIPAQATFRTPWQATVGARYALTSALTLNAQVVRFGWANFDTINLGALGAIPENYGNSWSFAGGVDLAVTPQWTVRGGVQRDETPTQNGARDARVPDGNRWNFALGSSFAATSALTLDVAANYIAIANASIDRPTAVLTNSPLTETYILPNGELTGAHVVVLSLGARVKF
jgi:long-chain fatty acid transport protein